MTGSDRGALLRLSRSRLQPVLERLDPGPNSNTMFLAAGEDAQAAKETLELMAGSRVPEPASKVVTACTSGCAIVWGDERGYVFLPALPLHASFVTRGIDLAPLLDHAIRDFHIGLVFVRMGEYALGLLKNERLLASKIGTGLVHARHRQGGSSAHRFERHRDKQIETFFSRVCGHAREVLGDSSTMDYLVYGGEKFTLLAFRKQCAFLKQFDERTLPKPMDVRSPRLASLTEAASHLLSFSVAQWDWQR